MPEIKITFAMDENYIRATAEKACEAAVNQHYGIGRALYETCPGRDSIKVAVKRAAEAIDLSLIIARVLNEAAEAAVREAATRDLSKRAGACYKRFRDANLLPPDPEAVKAEIGGEGR